MIGHHKPVQHRIQLHTKGIYHLARSIIGIGSVYVDILIQLIVVVKIDTIVVRIPGSARQFVLNPDGQHRRGISVRKPHRMVVGQRIVGGMDQPPRIIDSTPVVQIGRALAVVEPMHINPDDARWLMSRIERVRLIRRLLVAAAVNCDLPGLLRGWFPPQDIGLPYAYTGLRQYNQYTEQQQFRCFLYYLLHGVFFCKNAAAAPSTWMLRLYFAAFCGEIQP